MPGITSALSKARQSGPLELFTTDRAGNAASDGGKTFKAISELRAGIALANALEDPELATGERSGIRVNYGNFDGQSHAVGVTGIIVLRNRGNRNSRVAIAGGAAFGWGESFLGQSTQTSFGGRIGAQWTR
ncbi:MAG: hypothetical protein IIB62_09730 [Proteobacteria bacterium]|nr:hypothetical protein [Pseudomonadota bacterium]